MKSVIAHAPGKIMIAGEWSIMTPGNWCIVAPVNCYISVIVQASNKYCLYIDALGFSVDFFIKNSQILIINCSKKKWYMINFVYEALAVAIHFLSEQKMVFEPVKIIIKADTFMSGPSKFGLGTSAAVAVAVMKAIIEYFSKQVNKVTIFKLASIAHLRAQNMKGSCFDVAASAFETVIIFRSFDRNWLADQLKKDISLSEVIAQVWPLLSIEPCHWPSGWNISIGWTGVSSSTTQLISAMNTFQKLNQRDYNSIVSLINKTVLQLIKAIQFADIDSTKKLIAHHRKLLADLATISAIILETPRLTLLIEEAQAVGAAAKFSGAGGGDCGIALSFDPEIKYAVTGAWQRTSINTLDLEILVSTELRRALSKNFSSLKP